MFGAYEQDTFVWKNHSEDAWDIPAPKSFSRLSKSFSPRCYWCGTSLEGFSTRTVRKPRDGTYYVVEYGDACLLCGWQRCEGYIDYDQGLGPAEKWWTVKILREFDINSPQVAIAELGTFLKKRQTSLFDLSWQRFEELVTDVFKEHGLDVERTKLSRDGGADVLILTRGTRHVEAIIECKKYAQHRKVGIEQIRQLIGVCIDWDVRTAMLVTTSDFSSEARQAVAGYGKKGFEIDLKNANDILRLIECYNEDLPSLENLSYDERKHLIEEARKTWECGPENEG